MLGRSKTYLYCVGVIFLLSGLSHINFEYFTHNLDGNNTINETNDDYSHPTPEQPDNAGTYPWVQYSFMEILGLKPDINGTTGCYVVLRLPQNVGTPDDHECYIYIFSSWYSECKGWHCYGIGIYRAFRAFNDNTTVTKSSCIYVGSKKTTTDDYRYNDYVTKNGTYYYYHRYSYSDGSNTYNYESNLLSIDVNIDYSNLDAPILYSPNGNSSYSNSLTVQWDPIPRATSYIVYFSKTPDWSGLISSYEVTGTSFSKSLSLPGIYYLFVQSKAGNGLLLSPLSNPFALEFYDEDITVDISDLSCNIVKDTISFTYLDIDQSGLNTPSSFQIDGIYLSKLKIPVIVTNSGNLWNITFPSCWDNQTTTHIFSLTITDKDSERYFTGYSEYKDDCSAQITITFTTQSVSYQKVLLSTINEFKSQISDSNDEIWTNPNHKNTIINKIDETANMINENHTLEEVLSKINNDLRKHLSSAISQTLEATERNNANKRNGPEWLLDGDFALLCWSYLDKITEFAEYIFDGNLLLQNCITNCSILLKQRYQSYWTNGCYQ